MKLVKIVSAVMVATTLGATTTVVTPQMDMNAQAKAKKSLKTIPKKFRGTWYHYEKPEGYDYEKISAKKIKSRFEEVNDTLTMHQFDLKKGIKNYQSNWMFAYKHGKYYVMDGWGPYSGPKDNSHYSITTRKYKGKKVKVIKKTSIPTLGNTWWIYSPSKALAKHLWNLDNK